MMVFACDIGTSSLKTAIVNEKGDISFFLRTAFPPEVEAVDYALTFFAHFDKTLALLTEDGGNLSSIEGICVSGNGPSLVALPASSARASASESAPTDDIAELKTHKLFLWNEKPKEGFSPTPTLAQHQATKNTKSFFLPRIFLFAQSHPEIFSRAQILLPAPEYLSFILTGRGACFLPNEAFLPSYWTTADLESYQEALEKICPSPIHLKKKLPPFLFTCQRLGEYRGIPVLAGAPDFCMSLLGTKTIHPNAACDRAGTSEGLNLCLETRVEDSGLRVMPSILGSRWNAAAILGETGPGLKLFQNEIDAILAKKISLSQAKPALQEYFSRLCEGIESLERHTNRKLTFTVTGGQGENQELCRLKAKITGRAFALTQTPHAELLGCAIVGFTGLGYYPDLERGAEAMVRFSKTYDPSQ